MSVRSILKNFQKKFLIPKIHILMHECKKKYIFIYLYKTLLIDQENECLKITQQNLYEDASEQKCNRSSKGY